MGMGHVSPNPMVGCVVVHQDVIIGEGWHRQYGGAHAEVNALNDVKEPSLLSNSTVYVTLEPCTHYGKTPPCVDLLLSHRPARVVVCNIDPNPLVAGRGIAKLKEAGIPTEVGVAEADGLLLNRRFFSHFTAQRPYVILKWAQTADGFIARENYDSKWISNHFSRKLVHKWRAEEDAILVGKNTVLHDDPSLTVRDWPGQSPLRVVLDHALVLAEHHHVFDKAVPTVVYNLRESKADDGLEYVQCSTNTFLPDALRDLFVRKVLSVLVEGGASTLQQFIDAGLWNEARVFTAQASFGRGVRAPLLKEASWYASEVVLGDQLNYFKNSTNG